MDAIDMITTRIRIMFAVVSVLLIMIAIIIHVAKGNKTLFNLIGKNEVLTIGKVPRGITFGKLKLINRYVYSRPEKEQHTLVLGGTGLGKTSCLLIPSLWRWSGPKFVIDVSGDIHTNVPGHKFVIDPFGERTTRYNVFGAIDNIEDPNDQDLELMRLGILMMPEETQDSSAARYYHKGGLIILQAALVCGYHQGLDFIDICSVVRCSSLERLFELFGEDEKAKTLVASLIGQDPMNLAGCKDKADAVVELFALNRYVASCIGRDAGSVDPSCLENSSLYISIPTSELTACEQLMHVITSQVIDYVLSRNFMGTNKKRILLCLDELTALGKLDYLLDLLSRSRKNGCRVIALTQSLADLEMVYPREHRSMIENFGIKVILSAEEYATQEYLSNLIGDYKTSDFRYEKYYRPIELSSLGDNLLLVYRGGHILVRKTPYYKHPKLRPPLVATMHDDIHHHK